MKQVVATLFAACTLLLTAQTHAPVLHASRQAPTDLEVGTGHFISYQDLLRLPQVSFVTSGDTNFPVPARVSGVSLEQLRRSFDGDDDLVVAICSDGYRTNYPASYIAAHHPVLVLTVNGKPEQDWPKAHDGAGLGPYLIANPGFIPSFKVLAHSDEAQIPFQVVERGLFAARARFLARLHPRRIRPGVSGDERI